MWVCTPGCSHWFEIWDINGWPQATAEKHVQSVRVGQLSLCSLVTWRPSNAGASGPHTKSFPRPCSLEGVTAAHTAQPRNTTFNLHDLSPSAYMPDLGWARPPVNRHQTPPMSLSALPVILLHCRSPVGSPHEPSVTWRLPVAAVSFPSVNLNCCRSWPVSTGRLATLPRKLTLFLRDSARGSRPVPLPVVRGCSRSQAAPPLARVLGTTPGPAQHLRPRPPPPASPPQWS